MAPVQEDRLFLEQLPCFDLEERHTSHATVPGGVFAGCSAAVAMILSHIYPQENRASGKRAQSQRDLCPGTLLALLPCSTMG